MTGWLLSALGFLPLPNPAKTKGKLLPLGFIRLLKALKVNNSVDMLLVAVGPICRARVSIPADESHGRSMLEKRYQSSSFGYSWKTISRYVLSGNILPGSKIKSVAAISRIFRLNNSE